MDWAKNQYNAQYDKWVPWVEDLYLRWFTKDNKTSYVAKQNLDKTKVTGIEEVDAAQDGVNSLVTGQVGQGGLAEPVGDVSSREGMNRIERRGKDDKGQYAPVAGNTTGSIAEGGKAAASVAQSGA